MAKGHSAGTELNDEKEEAVSNPQSGQFWFFWTDSLLRRVGSNGESLGSGQSGTGELTSFILSCVTQEVICCHLCETSLGVEMPAVANDVLVLGVFKANFSMSALSYLGERHGDIESGHRNPTSWF